MRTFIATLVGFGLACSTVACKSGSKDDDGALDDGGTLGDDIDEDELPDTAAKLCELFYQCNCDDSQYEDELACAEAQRETTSEQQLAAQAAGLSHDEQCASEILAASIASGCATQFMPPCKSFCAVYHGQQGVDEPCTTPVMDQPTWSDCAQGLLCHEGTCADACRSNQGFLGLGDRCRDEEYKVLGYCDKKQGQHCDFDTWTCAMLPDIGEVCYDFALCRPGTVCDNADPVPHCMVAPKAGEACIYYKCDVGLYCDEVNNICATLPGEGEPCAPGQVCAEDHKCRSGLCAVVPPWVCQI